jgi:hypothetical protein
MLLHVLAKIQERVLRVIWGERRVSFNTGRFDAITDLHSGLL